MIDRLSLYGLLASLIPGVLMLTLATVAFPDIAGPVRAAQLPAEFAVLALLAAAMLAGLLIQALGSLGEPGLFLLFRGRPSERALKGMLGDRYLPCDAADRIKKKLAERVGGAPTDRSLFLAAMTLAESEADAKAGQFNAQYGYHRALLTLSLLSMILVAASRWWGAAAAWGSGRYWLTIALIVGMAVLLACRTYQRGVYYVREVLLTAERVLDAARRNATPPHSSASGTATESNASPIQGEDHD